MKREAQSPFNGNPDHLRNELNLRWSQLTREDLRDFDGRRDDLITLLQERYGFTRKRAEIEADVSLSQFEDRLRKAA